ncbi:GGDEF domain-containing protein [Loktanella sp. R86503]|uniref:GGDEF domain-containing protein n=1 Tax=Loktanella sp. R86503 TaxID=3093847 RepID=UPI0036D7AA4B
MKRRLLETMLSFSSEPCIVLDRKLQIVAANNLARTSLSVQAGDVFQDWAAQTAQETCKLTQCFGSTAQVRFALKTQAGKSLTACGWRLGGAFQTYDLIAVKLVETLRIKSGFATMTASHRSNLQRAKRLHLQKLQLEQENQLLAVQVETDPLTGLLNTRGLHRALQDAIDQKTKFALFYIDMNNLKAINDTLGHEAGDQAIRTLAQAIRDNSRNHDVAARIGGDEFALLTLNVDSLNILRNIGEAIATTLAQHSVTLSGDRIQHLSAAMGIARHPENGATIQALETAADQAMYASKRMALTTVIAGDARSKSTADALQAAAARHPFSP